MKKTCEEKVDQRQEESERKEANEKTEKSRFAAIGLFHI